MANFLDVVVLGIRMDAGFSEDVPPIMINLIFTKWGTYPRTFFNGEVERFAFRSARHFPDVRYSASFHGRGF